MNIWSEFKALIPTNERRLGTIADVTGFGIYKINLIGGGSMQVTGATFSLGTPVYVRGTVIEGAAPSLPAYSGEL